MTGTTATQKLTYPTSGDLLKEQAGYLETLARQVDARVAANVALLTSQLNRPLAIVDCTLPNSISATSSASLIQFDSVAVDTHGLVDLSHDRRVINFSSTGYWLIGAYVDFQGSPGGSNCASNGAIVLEMNSDNITPDRWSNHVKDMNNGHSYVQVSGLAQSTDPLNLGRIYLDAFISVGTTCSNTLTVAGARMWAFKVREL